MDKLTQNEALIMYNDMLNDSHEEIKICHSVFHPCDISKQLDPIAYHVGFNDYMSELSHEHGEHVLEFTAKD